MAERYFDVVIITPLEEEFSSALEQFKFEDDLSTETEVRFRVSVDDTALQVLLIKQAMMGKTAAQNSLFSVAQDYDIGLAVCSHTHCTLFLAEPIS